MRVLITVLLMLAFGVTVRAVLAVSGFEGVPVAHWLFGCASGGITAIIMYERHWAR